MNNVTKSRLIWSLWTICVRVLVWLVDWLLVASSSDLVLCRFGSKHFRTLFISYSNSLCVHLSKAKLRLNLSIILNQMAHYTMLVGILVSCTQRDIKYSVVSHTISHVFFIHSMYGLITLAYSRTGKMGCMRLYRMFHITQGPGPHCFLLCWSRSQCNVFIHPPNFVRSPPM